MKYIGNEIMSKYNCFISYNDIEDTEKNKLFLIFSDFKFEVLPLTNLKYIHYPTAEVKCRRRDYLVTEDTSC